MTALPGTRISAAQVRELLSDPKIFPYLAADDSEFVFDSLGLVWFLHLLELRHDVIVSPDASCFTGNTTAERIASGINAQNDRPEDPR